MQMPVVDIRHVSILS